MRSTVVELPPAVAHAVDLGREEGLTDIVSYCEGDILTADFGAGHDVVLLANILHHFDANRIASILKRARAALGQDGTVAIWEIEAPKRGSKVTAGDGSALYFRLTSTAGAYHGDEYANWVRAAGFARVKISRPAAAPGKVLVSARLEKY